MTERPILFSAPMVRALLDGAKTQTRRVLKPQPIGEVISPIVSFNRGREEWSLSGTDRSKNGDLLFRKFHNVGDVLWVKETWRTEARYDVFAPRDLPKDINMSFDADYDYAPNDGCRGRVRPSIFMMRHMSRINLRVTGVKVERLNDISAKDSIAEGVSCRTCKAIRCAGGESACQSQGCFASIASFKTLWESINGQGSWDANPWVVAYTFEVIKP